MENLIELLGSITAITFSLAMLNFFVKYFNKHFISKLNKDYKIVADYYRLGMKMVIKYHKLLGIISTISVAIHFYIAYQSEGISISGLIAAILLFIIFILGMYGAYLNKNYRGLWLKIHRILAFALMLAILIHLA